MVQVIRKRFGLNHAKYKEIKVLVDGVEKNACITENYLYRFVKKIIALNNLIFSIVFFNLCAILKWERGDKINADVNDAY